MKRILPAFLCLALFAAMSCAPEAPPPPASASAAIPPGAFGAVLEFRHFAYRAK